MTAASTSRTVSTLTEGVAEVAYKKAVETVTETVREETQKEDLKVVAAFKNQATAPKRDVPKKEKDIVSRYLDSLQNRMKAAAKKMLAAIQETLLTPNVKEANKALIKQAARASVIAMLRKTPEQRQAERDRQQQTKKRKIEQEL